MYKEIDNSMYFNDVCLITSSKRSERNGAKIKHQRMRAKATEAWVFYLEHMNESLDASEFNYLYYKKYAKQTQGDIVNPRTDYHLNLYQR